MKRIISWDEYFMGVAKLSAKRSKDPNTQVGCCIVNNDKRIVAVGYNGLPRNCDDNDFPWNCREGALQDTKFSKDATDISNIFNYFKSLKLELVDLDQLEQIKPGYAPKYYSFVTEDEIYYVYLNYYFVKYEAVYTVDFDVPEMEYAVEAYNILDHFGNHEVYFTTKKDPWVLDVMTYLGDLMIVEYDNNNKYHMSDELF